MKYKILTITNESGNEVFEKIRNGRGFVYHVIGNGQGYTFDKWMQKDWILQNIKDFINVGVSGDTIYPINEKSDKVSSKETAQSKKIEDFGQKIGGAKKDTWKKRGLMIGDLVDFNGAEREKYIRKDNIWVKPNYQALIDEGLEKVAVVYIKLLRDAIPQIPNISANDSVENKEKKQELFIEFVGSFRDYIMNTVKSADDIDIVDTQTLVEFGLIEKIQKYYSYNYTDKGKVCSGNLFKVVQYELEDVIANGQSKGLLSSSDVMIIRMKIIDTREYDIQFNDNKQGDRWVFCKKNGSETRFYYLRNEEQRKDLSYYQKNPFAFVIGQEVYAFAPSIELAEEFRDKCIGVLKNKDTEKNNEPTENQKKNRKQAFVPEQLAEVKRVGSPVRSKNIEGQDFINDFKIRGGEFGNWVNETERQLNMNAAYEAFKDLALVLGISDRSVSLNGELSIAFGSRGNGNAMAHYEPLRKVINLTRMKGAGNLAHEYFHAIDNLLGQKNGVNFMTSVEEYQLDRYSPAISELVLRMRRYKYEIADSNSDLEEKNTKIKRARKKCIEDMKDYIPYHNEDEKSEIDKELEKFVGVVLSGQRLYTFSDYGDDFIPNECMKDFFEVAVKIKGQKIKKKDVQRIMMEINHYVSRIEENRPKKEKHFEVRESDYLKNSRKIDSTYAKTTQGYWSDTTEMAARAFECYVKDKLEEKGLRNDYLCGQSEMYSSDGTPAIPLGNERVLINEAFDAVIEELKEKGFFERKNN